jgi:hypothetical protein
MTRWSRRDNGITASQALVGIGAGLLSFVVLGTVAAPWPNPLFIRMVPTAGYEIPLLAVQSALLALYVAMRRPACRLSTMGDSSVINFLGVACPICNKILLLTFGATALLTYFEPARLYVGLAGVGLGLMAVVIEGRGRWRDALPDELDETSKVATR